jgi:hypothetical protein
MAVRRLLFLYPVVSAFIGPALRASLHLRTRSVALSRGIWTLSGEVTALLYALFPPQVGDRLAPEARLNSTWESGFRCGSIGQR